VTPAKPTRRAAGAAKLDAVPIPPTAKAEMQQYLQRGRDVLLWKLDGLSEYDLRRPIVPTGTNLLGLVKHVATMEVGYFGAVFGRVFPDHVPSFDDDADPQADWYATADETKDGIVAFYRRAWAHSDATIESRPLDAMGAVPWWPEDRRDVTLHLVLVHMIAETDRHAGHADILRELIDGGVGHRADNDNLSFADEATWAAYHRRMQALAEQFLSG
jgi:hypothetical protein